MSAKLKELQERRNKLAKEIRDLADKQDSWAAEDRQKWDALNNEYDKELMPALLAERKRVEDEAAQREVMSKRVAELGNYQDWEPRNTSVAGRLGRDGGSVMAGPQSRYFQAQTPEARQQFSRLQVLALQGWMLAGSAQGAAALTEEHVDAARALRIDLNSREVELRIGDTNHFRNAQKFYRAGTRSSGNGETLDFINGRQFFNDMQAGKGSTGGFLVGETFLSRLEFAMLDYSGVLQVAEVLRTETGEPMLWPTMDDTANSGARVGESQDAGFASPVDPKVGRLRLQAFTFHSNFLFVSRTLMMDSFINLEEMFGDMMGIRIGRKQNTDFTTGADVGNGPIGIVTAATSGLTTASSTAIAFDEVIDLVHKIDPARRRQPGVGYMFHDLILNNLRKLKDGMGRYLWSQGTQAANPDTLNGYSYWINQAMDSTISSGKKTMLFGQLPMYKVRQVNGLRLQRLVERRAEYDEDCFIAYLRADGGLLDPGDHPVKYMTH